MEVAVLYAYHETAHNRRNLEFFCRYGMRRTRDVRYVLVVNGGECSAAIGDRWSHVIKRPNTGFDFAAWRTALLGLNLEQVTHVVCVNASVIGPFGDRDWIQTFLGRLDDKTALVGASINCHTGAYARPFNSPSAPHVQSMLWAMTAKTAKDDLCSVLAPDLDGWSKTDGIINVEFGLSMRLLRKGLNIACMCDRMNVDYTDKKMWSMNPNAWCGDPWYPGAYFGRDLHPYETIFYKSNRGVGEEELRRCIEIQERSRWY